MRQGREGLKASVARDWAVKMSLRYSQDELLQPPWDVGWGGDLGSGLKALEAATVLKLSRLGSGQHLDTY